MLGINSINNIITPYLPHKGFLMKNDFDAQALTLYFPQAVTPHLPHRDLLMYNNFDMHALFED